MSFLLRDYKTWMPGTSLLSGRRTRAGTAGSRRRVRPNSAHSRLEEKHPQPLARAFTNRKIEAIDDREAKTARRHGVLAGRLVGVEGDLHARYRGHRADRIDQRLRRMAVVRPVRAEQHDAIAVAAVRVGVAPDALPIEPH